MAGKVYPEWVQAQKRKGTTIKKVGDNYYLYKHSSKRVPGKKYPVPVDTYIGVITPEGVVESKKKKISMTSAEVWEYGFSKVLWLLCPEDWKSRLVMTGKMFSQLSHSNGPLNHIFRGSAKSNERRIFIISLRRRWVLFHVGFINHRVLILMNCENWRQSTWYVWKRKSLFQK